MSEEIYSKFSENFSRLSNDIKFIEIKIENIQDRITEIDLQLNHIKQTIPTLTGADKAKMYNIYNEILKLLSQFYSNLSVLIDLRQKYRSQEGDLKYKSVRLIELEMNKLEQTSVSHDNVLKTLQTMDVDSLIQDEKYKI
jgi:chromosome segregation ATPase